ncbi:MAG: hypothetical protein II337_09365 [Clostridia bacterium]|nr:hypothetical protein [Clostridia bacterium]
MLIDLLTERYVYSQEGPVISVIIYILAAAVALLLRQIGQARGREIPFSLRTFKDTVLPEFPAALWSIFFFLLTGCLKAPVRKEARTNDAKVNRKIFFTQISFLLVGAGASFFLYTSLQFFASITGFLWWNIPLLFMKALTGASISLLIFSLIPLPDSDADLYLRTKPLGEKGEAFRRNGTWPFFVTCILGFTLACLTLPMPSGDASVSALITLFPILLIGG